MVLPNNQRKIKYWYIFVLFLFITDLNWMIFPISTRKLIGLIGLVTFALRRFRSQNLVLNRGLCLYFGCIMILCVSSIINAYLDTAVLSMFIGRILTVLASYYILTTWRNINLILFLKTFLGIVLFNDFFAFVLFLIPSLSNFFMTLEPATESVMEIYGGLRFIGLGAFRFFEGGVINALALISVFYLLLDGQLTKFKSALLIVLALFLGTFIARTTLTGLIGLMFFLYPSWSTRKTLIKVSIGISSVAVFVFLFLNSYFSDNPALEWAFEVIYNYLEKGSIETTSTDSLLTMYVFPDTLKSWIIGDGQWLSNNGGYYMHTDVGFCRLLLLFGLIGTSFFFLYFLWIFFKTARNQDLRIQFLFSFIYILLILVNLKGFSDFSYFIFPLLFYVSRNKRKIGYEKLQKKNLSYL